MLFNSIAFFVFLPIVLILYWLLRKNLLLQNLLLLVSSYFFYGWWDWRFCFLLFASSTFGFFAGILIAKTKEIFHKKLLLFASIALLLSSIGYFKYYNFVIDSINNLGIAKLEIKNIILPLAISFFTFHIISYLVDMYRNSYTVAKDYIPFIMHISFFPQLVAGPIERVGHLLPQFRTEKKFNTQLLVDGGRQMLWGFFKKLAIADTLSQEVNYIFSNHEALSGSTIAVGVIMFSIQIYCDFSGYTDIALGVARMMGIELLRNFKYPYFSENISDFWQRWHLSLSTWFRDYLYISLGGNRVSIPVMYINVIIVFLVSGLWHGANWTFVVWGGLHGLYWLIENFSRRNFKNGIVKFYFESRYLSPFRILITFGLVSLAWLFFRAKTFTQAWEMLKSIFSNSLFTNPEISQTGLKGLGLAAGMIIIEWIQRKKEHGLQIQGVNYAIRWFAYAIIFMLIFAADNLNKQSEFIYFQF